MIHKPHIEYEDCGGIFRGVPERVWWRIKHALFVLSAVVGLRDRLRCPKCRAVGTWKPHENPSRWLCKCCGWYEDIRRTGWAAPCNRKRVWMLRPLRPGRTPYHRVGRVWPWRG